MSQFTRTTAAALALALTGTAGYAVAAEVNVYSARHYQTDQRLYEEFTEQTGIEVNRIEESGEKLTTRLVNEGRNSPADVFVTVDAGRLWRAEEQDLFDSVQSDALEQKIPAHLRHPEGKWFGFSKRARIIFYDPSRIQDPPETYEDLADPKYNGEICIRSSSNIYNLSLMASMIAEHGEEKALEWAQGVVSNMARDPQGGDTDQIKAVAAGECGIAVANSYYYVRLMKSEDAGDREVAEKVEVVFPNQDGRGTHVNISGAGVLKHAPNRDEAIRLLEYLASPSAQAYFAQGNNEYPAVEGAEIDSTLASLGEFKEDAVNVSVYGENQPLAQKLFDRAGWK